MCSHTDLSREVERLRGTGQKPLPEHGHNGMLYFRSAHCRTDKQKMESSTPEHSCSPQVHFMFYEYLIANNAYNVLTHVLVVAMTIWVHLSESREHVTNSLVVCF